MIPLIASTLFASQVSRLSNTAQKRLASFGAGAASAYVFLYVLPKLAEVQPRLESASSAWPLIEYLYHHAYVVAMVGFVVFYLVNVVAQESHQAVPRSPRGAVLLIGLAVYGGALGDIIGAQREQPTAQVLFSVALTLHLLGLNAKLRERLPDSWGWLRWVFAAALTLGWLTAIAGSIPPAVHALASAWIAGGIIMLVMLIEMPQERRVGAFTGGVATMAALIKLGLVLSGSQGGL